MGRVGRFILKVAAVLILIVSVGVFALSLFTGETRNKNNLQSEFDYLITVGISQSGEDDSWKEANTQSFMDTFVEANGYEVIYADAGLDQEKQIADLESFIKQDVDYIILNPVSEIGWEDVLEEAKEAHIPVILINNSIETDDSSLYACTLGSDYAKQMKNAGKWLNEYLKEEKETLAQAQDEQAADGTTADKGKTADSTTTADKGKTADSTTTADKGKAADSITTADKGKSANSTTTADKEDVADSTIGTDKEKAADSDSKIEIAAIQEFIGSEEQLIRAQGYQTMLEKYQDLEMVAQQTGNNSGEEAKKVMRLFLEQDPKLHVVFAESDEMALGAIEAIEESGKTCGENGDIIVISFGGTKEGIEAVKEGKLNVTFECNPKQGIKAAEIIQRLESGISIDKEQYVEETYFDGTMDLDKIIEDRTY